MRYCSKCGNERAEGENFCPKCGTPVIAEEVSPTTAPILEPAKPAVCAEFKMAFWGERFVAWLIDVAIVGVGLLVIGFFTTVGGFSFNFTLLPGWLNWMPFLFSFNLNSVIFFLYWMFMDSAYGQSIGKMVMRLKVTRLDGSPVSASHAALESAGKAFFLPIDVLIGWLLYPKCRQRIFNYISQTIVIKAT